MARKKTAQPKGDEMPATMEPKTKAIRLDLPEDDHQALRVLAAKEGMSMAAYVRDLVLERVRESRKRGGRS